MNIVNVYLEEYDEGGEIVFATWYRGFFKEGVYYGVKCSCSPLDRFLKVSAKVLTPFSEKERYDHFGEHLSIDIQSPAIYLSNNIAPDIEAVLRSVLTE